MAPQLFPVERPGRPGRLSLLARPRGGGRLDDELAGLVGAGVEVLVSLLTRPEEAELGLGQERRLVERRGLRYVALPVPDLGVPDAATARAVAGDLAAELASGAHVALHCRGTLGRAPTLAACVLAEEGLLPPAVWEVLTRARGSSVPETDEQRALVERLYGSASS